MEEQGIKRLLYNKRIWIYLCVMLVYVGGSVAFAKFTNLLNCGYFFADDHEIVRMNYTVDGQGLLYSLGAWMGADIHIRFRPLYWFIRVMESFGIGNNIFLWHTFKAMEIGLMGFLLYLFARLMRCNPIVAVAFSIVPILGEQCAVVFRLGPQEPLATICLTLCLIACIAYQKCRRRWIGVSLCLLTTCMACAKEAFTLLVPFVILFLFYLELKEQETVGLQEIKACFVKFAGVLMYAIALSIFCVGFIVFFTGTGSTGYAGFDGQSGAGFYVQQMLAICNSSLKPYLILFAGFFLLYLVSWLIGGKFAQNKKDMLLRLAELLMPLYFIATQLLLHAKSGMMERYLIPCILGIYLYAFILGERKLEAFKIGKVVWTVVVVAMTIYFAIASNIVQMCKDYAADCVNNMVLLDRINVACQATEGQDTKVIVCTNYGERNLAISAFQQELYGNSHVYSLSHTPEEVDYCVDRYVTEESVDGDLFITDASVYMDQGGLLTMRMIENGMDPAIFQQIQVGYYLIYYR